MRIIISPAKKMVVDTDTLTWRDLPALLDKTELLKDWICSLSYDQQKALWACNDSIAQQNAERFSHMDLQRSLTPAILAYDGIQYTSMAPTVFTEREFTYVQDHLRILSGFYGVLRPFDGVAPYRLEMQAKAAVAGHANLYDFWGDALYNQVMDDPAYDGRAQNSGNDAQANDVRKPASSDRVLINLASKEYSKAIEKHLQPGDAYITCVFGELDGAGSQAKVAQKGVYAKMARGEMVRYLAGIQAEEPVQLRGFNWSGYAFDEARSTESTFVFVRAR